MILSVRVIIDLHSIVPWRTIRCRQKEPQLGALDNCFGDISKRLSSKDFAKNESRWFSRAICFVGLRRGSEIAFRVTGNVRGGLSVVVVRVLPLPGIFVDAALGVLPFNVVVVLDFVGVDDDAEGFG